MRIVINYDFFNAIKDVNEDFNVFKVIRNNKNQWIKFDIPVLTAFEYAVNNNDFGKHMSMALCVYFPVVFSLELINYKLLGDVYKDRASERLKTLIPYLNDCNVNTDYDLIRKSQLNSKIYNIRLNAKKIPYILESKYLLVPSYDYKKDIIDTPVLQEHVVGSKLYTLSTGSKQKKLQLVYQTN